MSPQRGIKTSQLDHEDYTQGIYNGEVSVVSGDYILGLQGSGTKTFSNANLTRLWASPMPISRAVTIDRLTVDVITEQAASLNRLGLYRSKADGTPGALVVDAGTVDTSTSGVKEATVDVTLRPGLYWGAWEYDVVNVGLRGHNEEVSLSLGYAGIGNNSLGIVHSSHTFADGSLPDQFGTIANYFGSSLVGGNVIWARVA